VYQEFKKFCARDGLDEGKMQLVFVVIITEISDREKFFFKLVDNDDVFNQVQRRLRLLGILFYNFALIG
jgi:predicted Holliday junction resolvase-like endonuclease